MTTERSIPLLAALAVAALCFFMCIWVDGGAVAATSREADGSTRGTIVDRNGMPLAVTRGIEGNLTRAYLTPGLAPTVGYADPAGGWHGLERLYNRLLSGDRSRSDWRTFFLHLHGQSAMGGRLRLTLDRHLQSVAYKALGPGPGAVVALDPSTGGVLAMVSKPDCEPWQLARPRELARCRQSPRRPMLDRAIQRPLAPGSTFKIVTLSAAIDSGTFHLSDVFSGADIFGPNPLFDNTLYPSNITRSDLTALTLAQALAFSDNFTFAHVGLTLGARVLLDYAHRYLIGRHIPFDFPVAPSTVAQGSSNPTPSILAQSSFGAEVDKVTPLQMALIAETVANKGVMMAPHLIAGTQAASGQVISQATPRQIGRVMKAAAAAEVTNGMIFVVDHGSGLHAQIQGVKVAGKTGTATSSGSKPNAWFICFAPAQHPVVAVAVLRETSGEGADFAAPVARQVLIAALKEHGFHVH